MRHSIPIFLLFLISQLSINAQTPIPSRKKFEWGAGMLSFKGGHYRGSDQSREWFIPLPYFSYSSERIEAEPSFIRGTFFKNDWVALKLSVIAGLNVESEKNRARRGMPELDYTFEFGPMLIFNLWKSESKTFSLTLETPFRMVNTTDFTYVKDVGFFSVPYMNLKVLPTKQLYNWGLDLAIGYMWGSERYHDFFYGVDPQYATNSRPTYYGRDGYSGMQYTLVFNKRYKDFVFVPFIRHDSLGGVAFEDSPLLKKKSYTLGGLAFFWLFGNSL